MTSKNTFVILEMSTLNLILVMIEELQFNSLKVGDYLYHFESGLIYKVAEYFTFSGSQLVKLEYPAKSCLIPFEELQQEYALLQDYFLEREYSDKGTLLGHYQLLAHTTAAYPEEHAIPYFLSGLASEILEFQMALNYDLSTGNMWDKLTKEIGDQWWFIAELCRALDIDMHHGWYYLASTGQTFGYEFEEDKDLLNIGEEFASLCAKWLRKDPQFQNVAQFKTRIRKEILSLLHAVYSEMKPYYSGSTIPIQRYLKVNILKLSKRAENGTIKGEGDDR